MPTKYEVTVEPAEEYPYEDQYGVGCCMRETWRLDGKINRFIGPAVTVFHPGTGLPVMQQYYSYGKLHGMPAVVHSDPYTGKEISRQNYIMGVLDTGDNPIPGFR